MSTKTLYALSILVTMLLLTINNTIDASIVFIADNAQCPNPTSLAFNENNAVLWAKCSGSDSTSAYLVSISGLENVTVHTVEENFGKILYNIGRASYDTNTQSINLISATAAAMYVLDETFPSLSMSQNVGDCRINSITYGVNRSIMTCRNDLPYIYLANINKNNEQFEAPFPYNSSVCDYIEGPDTLAYDKLNDRIFAICAASNNNLNVNKVVYTSMETAVSGIVENVLSLECEIILKLTIDQETGNIFVGCRKVEGNILSIVKIDIRSMSTKVLSNQLAYSDIQQLLHSKGSTFVSTNEGVFSIDDNTGVSSMVVSPNSTECNGVASSMALDTQRQILYVSCNTGILAVANFICPSRVPFANYQCSSCQPNESFKINMNASISASTSFQLQCSLCPAGSNLRTGKVRSCVKCPLGSFSNSSEISCNQCIPGSYSNTEGSSQCKLCEPGRWQSAPEQAECNNCSIGSFSANPGSTVCSQCSTGYGSLSGYSTCVACEPGYFSSIGCIKCPIGKYSAESRSSICLNCFVNGTGTLSEGSSSCTICEPGYFSNRMEDGGQICSECGSGSYSERLGATSCEVCKPGSYSEYNTGSTSCQSCVPGFYSNYGVSSCSRCDSGSYTNSYNSTFCMECLAGSYSIAASSSCTLCELGKYSNENKYSSCKYCDIGSYTDSLGSKECIKCSAGTYVNASGSSTVCTQCELGKYTNITGASSCINCAAGFYTDRQGSMECIPCPAGSYSSESGSTSCTLCELGKYSDSTSNTSCIACDRGRYTSVNGSTVCSICTAGNRSNKRTMSTECVPCQPNYYSNADGKSYCIACDIGKYSGEGATVCDLTESATSSPTILPTNPQTTTPSPSIPEPSMLTLPPISTTLEPTSTPESQSPSSSSSPSIPSESETQPEPNSVLLAGSSVSTFSQLSSIYVFMLSCAIAAIIQASSY